MNNITSSSFNYWGLHLLSLPVSTFVVEGLAKISDFEVLRHGTSFPQYLNILQTGANPQLGGSTTTEVAFDESTIKQAMACKNRFYLFKDSEAYFSEGATKIPVIAHLMKRYATRVHAALAGATFAKETQNKVLRIAQKILYGMISLFCPTLRFVYQKKEFQKFNSEEEFKEQLAKDTPKIPRFISDEDYQNIAYKTPDALPNDRIGLIGLCKHAQWVDIKKTFSAKPGQFLLGTIQLIIGIYFTTLGLGILI